MSVSGENHLTQDEPTGNIDGIDADALMEQVENGGSREIPMEQPSARETAAPAPAAPQEYEFDYKGQKIKASLADPKFKTWLQQGYDYSQNTAALKKERETWESERKSWDPYKRIDEYAKQNPDWWAQVEQAYQARTQGGPSGASPANPELQALNEKLQGLEKFKESFETQQAEARAKEEDGALDQEIQSIREQFKDLDWTAQDKSGLTLEQRVLKHGMDMGLNGSKPGHFRAAFRDYNHDHLIQHAKENGLASQTKEIQKRSRLGIIGTSPTPKKGITPAVGVKDKSYNDLMREGLEEFGSSTG